LPIFDGFGFDNFYPPAVELRPGARPGPEGADFPPYFFGAFAPIYLSVLTG